MFYSAKKNEIMNIYLYILKGMCFQVILLLK